MRTLFKNVEKSYLLAIIISLLIYIGSASFQSSGVEASKVRANNDDDTAFAGSMTCKQCHNDIYQSHILTAHYRTSALPSASSIKGSFATDKNRFKYSKFMEVVMEHQSDSFFQTGYIGGVEYQREAFGVVIGSGRKGQTYLYWKGSNLFQLPVSYYVPAQEWCNSPGFPASMIYFDRPILSRCIECHGTYANAADMQDGTAVFDRSSIIYGVDCERCHGPAQKHVSFHQANPNEKIARFIVNARVLTRQQRMDACALCHSGFRKQIKPAFSFMVGDTLSNYSLATYNPDSSSWLDVHGNQYGLLTSSKCFKSSDKMDCSSCHNVHKVEINNPKLFSARCMNCHNEASHNYCTLPEVTKFNLKDACITCHMPLMPSKKIFLQMQNQSDMTADLVRNHRIAIYSTQTQKYLASLGQKQMNLK